MAFVKEVVTRGLFVAAAVWGGRVTWQLHQVVRARQLKQPDSYPKYADFQWSCIVCVCFLVAQFLFERIFRPVARTMIPKKPRWSEAVWGAKVHRCCDALFKCCYYSAMTVWAISFLGGKTWVPRVLGGSGETRFCWTDGIPFQPIDDDLRHFYLTAIGYHLCEVVAHIMDFGLPDFWEMLLHHTVTAFLVSYSYLLNYVRIGSLVLVLHGSTDIFIYLSKFLVDTGNVYSTAVSYFSLVLSYAWFRIYVFPTYVMKSAWIESLQVAGADLPAWGFLNFSLCVLLLLHMYWFSLIIKIGVNYKKTGVARDMISNLTDADLLAKDKKKM
jgi:hypothetical protein